MKYLLVFLTVLFFSGCTKKQIHRTEISLNGSWEIARTDTLSGIPSDFRSKAPVPGLVDLADPPVEPLNTFVIDTTWGYNRNYKNRSLYYNDSKYWYRKVFSIEESRNRKVLLKINKAQYHTWVYVNGKLAGENVYCFTPTLINIKPFLNKDGIENELIIAVGSRNNLPDTVVNGCDYEKVLFVPGIYDDVKIILTGDPQIINVQTVPEPECDSLRVVAEIAMESDKPVRVSYTIRESVSKTILAKGSFKQKGGYDGKKTIVDFSTAIPGARLWSPEDPFLYDLELSTGGDNTVTHFGMRSFSASRDSGVVLLNGKPYFMRGTNVCFNRFAEDSSRGNLPWNKQWVVKLHNAFKNLHGNGIRYCIGFPPEIWYEVADSIGFLIQDEYPVWGFNHPDKPSKVNSDHLAAEYKEWMRERWNHPCVVIWDAQNETPLDTTSRAIPKVRDMDLSKRPWENGYAHPASEADVMEAHPYLFWPYYEKLNDNKKLVLREGLVKDLLKKPQLPNGSYFIRFYKGEKPLRNPIIINEYDILWLNRDGSPTTFTKVIYEKLYPESDTPEKRFEQRAKLMGMLTEYWRAHRKVAGVLEFCGLGYSRPNPPYGQTSDFLIDVKNAIIEPYYVQYLRPAFNPVGLMLDFWDEKLKTGSEITFPLNLINDTYENWKGSIKLSLLSKELIINEQVINCEIAPLGREIYSATLKMPANKGKYRLVGEITYKGESVKSIREFSIEE
jgi:beta-galactosidase